MEIKVRKKGFKKPNLDGMKVWPMEARPQDKKLRIKERLTTTTEGITKILVTR